MRRVTTTRSSGAVVVALAVLALMVPAAAGGATTARATVVGPNESIQTAVDAAGRGDTIHVLGTHRENVAIRTDGVTLRGVGAVLLPPAVPAVHACFDPTEVDEAVHGICVIGDFDFDTGDVLRRVEGVTVTGFTVRGFTGSGIVAVAAHATRFSDNVVADNGDAGISAGQSTDTLVLSNRASGGRFGVFLTAARGGRVAGNLVHDNCVGVFALDLGLGASGAFRVVANAIRHNTRACPPNEDFPELSGVGVALIGGTDNTVAGNLITDNVPLGATAIRGGLAIITSPAGPAPNDTAVRGNAILRNDPDLFWDETGSGNVLTPNLCRTSAPARLCG
jgi:parallel beta-helix repeat protein